MDNFYTFYSYIIVFTSAICIASAGFALFNRTESGSSGSFALLMFGAAAWNLPIIPFLLATTVEDKLFWTKVEYVGITIVPSAFITFCFQQTGRSAFLTTRNLVLIYGGGLLIFLLAATNEWHHLVWRSIRLLEPIGPYSGWAPHYGPFFWFMNLWAYSFLLSGTIMLVTMVLRSGRSLFRRQALGILVSVFVPMVANIVYNLGMSPLPGVEIVPLAFGVSGLILSWGLFGLRFLDLIPVARDLIFESMSDCVVVLDPLNRIVDLNAIAVTTIATGRTREELIGKDVASVLSASVQKHGGRLMEATTLNATGEIDFGGKTFHVRVTPLADSDKDGPLSSQHRGRLVVLRDVTSSKRQEQDLIKARQDADQANQAKSAFLATMSVG